MTYVPAAPLSALSVRTGRPWNKQGRRAQDGGGFGEAGGEHVVDQLSGAGGSAQADGFKACLPWFYGITGAEDQLFAKPVYFGGARQHGRAGDPEILQATALRPSEPRPGDKSQVMNAGKS